MSTEVFENSPQRRSANLQVEDGTVRPQIGDHDADDAGTRGVSVSNTMNHSGLSSPFGGESGRACAPPPLFVLTGDCSTTLFFTAYVARP